MLYPTLFNSFNPLSTENDGKKCHGLLYPEYKAVGLISVRSKSMSRPALEPSIHPNLLRLTIDINWKTYTADPRLDLLIYLHLSCQRYFPTNHTNTSSTPSVQIECDNGLVVRKQVTLPALNLTKSMPV